MKLLLVDDDKIVIDSMVSEFPWISWGITEIRTAWSVREAREILSRERIDILFCDIEMPMATGIELIEWMKQELDYEVVTLLLTCHSEFQYAQRALQLGCRDYLLKPVDEDTLKKAVFDAEETVLELRKRERERLRSEQKIRNMDAFWELLLACRVSEGKKMQTICDEYGVNQKECWFPVLVVVKHHTYRRRDISVSLMSFILENVIREVFHDQKFALVNHYNERLWLFFPETARDLGLEITEKLNQILEWVQENYHSVMSCYMGEIKALSEWDAQCRLLTEADERFAVSPWVYSPAEVRYRKHFFFECSLIAKNRFLKLFSDKKYEKLLDEMRVYFYALTPEQCTTAALSAAVKQLDQEFAKRLDQNEMKKFQKEQVRLIGENPNYIRSIPGMFEYYERLFACLKNEEENSESVSLIEKVKLFVSMNISEEIGREEVASHVGLHPDYLNRLFKKETGKSLKEYITDEKIGMACELLEQTDILVGEIGEMVGYVNFSSFSTFFKSRTGMTPGAWRKEHGKC